MSSGSPEHRATPFSENGWIRALTWTAILSIYGWLTARFWFIADDAYISFRYARNLAHGLGLRFNATESPPVEGYSNFLWTLACAPLEAIRLDPAVWTPFASIASALVVLWRVSACLVQSEVSQSSRLLAVAALACFPPFALWSTSGMETMTFTALLFLAFERLVFLKQPDWLVGGAAALLTALIRVEGIAWVFVTLVIAATVRLRSRESCRFALLRASLVVAIGFAAYFAWRMGYYQSLLPNTVYAKAGLDGVRLQRGFYYVLSYALTFITPILLVPATVVALMRRRWQGAAVAAMAWGFVAYSVLVTGDFMPMGRFILPALPFGAILFGWLLDGLAGGSFRRRAISIAAGLGTFGIGLLPAWDLHLVPASARALLRFRHNSPVFRSEYGQWQIQRQNTSDWTRLGMGLRDYAAQRGMDVAQTSFVVGAIGAVGYHSGLNIVDQHGLVTTDVARRSLGPDVPLRSPGHDKYVPASFFLPSRPAILDATLLSGVAAAEAGRVVRRMQAAISREISAGRDSYHADVARVSPIHPDGMADYVAAIVRSDAEGANAAESQRRLATLESGAHLPRPDSGRGSE